MKSSANLQRLLVLAACWVALLPRGASAQAAGGPDPVSSSQRGAISGRVMSDSGHPISGATVFMWLAGPNRSVRSAYTDEEGRFNAEGLKEGRYLIQVDAPGYVMSGNAAERSDEAVHRPGDSVSITLYKGGVVTGTVTDAGGEPVVGATVRAIRVRDAVGKPVLAGLSLPEGVTDDRGVYRIYGLSTGGYVVAAGGASASRPATGLYRNDAPTFYPSGTRDGAAEVRVDLGLEAKGIDIRYRGGVGYAISGTVTGLPAGATVWLTLNFSGTSTTLAAATAGRDQPQGFAFYGVPEGQYTLHAFGAHSASQSSAFAAPQVTVKGADVSGLHISLAPLGSIAGRVQFQHTKADGQECGAGAAAEHGAVVLTARRDERGRGRTRQTPPPLSPSSDRADDANAFLLNSLESGLYRLEVRLPAKELYVGSITFKPGAAAQASKPADAARDGLAVKPGEKVEGVSVTVFDGAASLQGRVAAQGNSPAPARLYLVPAERESADDVLRYAEAEVAADGSFGLTNLAPGRYWVVTRRVPAPEDDRAARPAAWDTEGRAKLRREAEAANLALELRPCQRVEGYAVRRPSPPASGKPAL